jgi:hypothetical protein
VTSSYDTEFAQFVRRRARLNERLDSTRAQIDAWIEEHQGESPNMVALATLEVLLKTRRDALAELVRLDDAFVDHLIALKGGAGEPPTA